VTLALVLLLVVEAAAVAPQAPQAGADPPRSQTRPAPSPADRSAALQLAQNELASGRRTEARRLLAGAADRFGSVEALLQLSRLQSEDGDAAGALESLRKAREMAPNSEDVLSAFAQVSLAAGAPVPAILALDSLTRICPTVAQHRYLLGVALMRAGDMLAAVDALREAERLEPNRPLTLLALGIALNAGQRYADAKPFLMRSLALEPEDVNVVAALAEAEQGVGELDSAAAHVQRALSRAPNHATANLVAGLIAMDQTRYAEARAAFERSIAADPESPRSHYQLSLACSRLGDSSAAAQAVEKYKETLRKLETRVNALRAATGPPQSSVKGAGSKQAESKPR
jgi:tetratricopeptide (TPR) repeat protein